MTGPSDEKSEKLAASSNIPIFPSDIGTRLCSLQLLLQFVVRLRFVLFSCPLRGGPPRCREQSPGIGHVVNAHGVRVVTESDSGCVACLPDMDCSSSSVDSVDRPEWTVAPSEASSEHTTEIPVFPSANSVKLDWDTIKRIANQRDVVLQAVAEGRVSADLFSALDEDSDSYV